MEAEAAWRAVASEDLGLALEEDEEEEEEAAGPRARRSADGEDVTTAFSTAHVRSHNNGPTVIGIGNGEREREAW